MGTILFLIAYLVYAAFWSGIALRVCTWYRAAKQAEAAGPRKSDRLISPYAMAALDLCLFRRLFLSNKLLWLGSWVFHVSFLFVILRHLRYLMNPVPGCITAIQPFGVVAGYVLPASLCYLIVLRIAGKDRYVSKYVSNRNYFLLGMLLLISITGVLMRRFYLPDLMGAKEFILGICTFTGAPVPTDRLFIIHLVLVLVLVPWLPTHFLSAPLVLIEARKREEERRMILHEK